MNRFGRLFLTLFLLSIAISLSFTSCILLGGQTGGSTETGGGFEQIDGGPAMETEFALDAVCPLGMSAAEVLQQLSEISSATLSWRPVGGQSGQTGVTVEIGYTGETITFIDYADPRCDLLYGTCDALRIPVRITVRTDDGLFNEQWQGQVHAYQNGTIEARSTKPIDLRNLNGSYPAASFIQDDPVFSVMDAENMQSMEADVIVHYGKEERYGTIEGRACATLDKDDKGSTCKSAGIADWSL